MFKVSWLFDFSTPVRLVAPRVERSPIFALAISPSAKFLASGGEYGVQLWSLKDYAPIATPITSGLRGPTSSIAWLEREIGETLVYGTALGWLGCWRQNSTEFKELCAHRTGEGCEIASLATDAGTCRIASAARDGSIQVWTFNAEESLISLFSVRLDRTTPICVAFKDNTTKDIFVFGIYDGERFVLRGNDGKILSRETTNIMMGRVAVSSKRRQYVLDNGMDGFDVRDLENNAHVVRLPTDRVKVSRPKQVAFANDDTLVVGGSDHGVIYVFDRTTGIVLDKYTHSKGGLVQTIATHDIGDDIIIAGATSGEGSDPYISLWRYKVPRTARSALLGNVVATAYSLARFLRVLLVAVAYLWDIIGFIGIFCSLFPNSQVAKYMADVDKWMNGPTCECSPSLPPPPEKTWMSFIGTALLSVIVAVGVVGPGTWLNTFVIRQSRYVIAGLQVVAMGRGMNWRWMRDVRRRIA